VNELQSVGRYRLIERIGQGAMGVVYRAHDPQLERDVAVKVIAIALASGHGDGEETGARFAREARVAARLLHPNIVAIYDAGEAGGQLYLVMELVAGESLARQLARGEFPTPARALDIVAQAADALAAAHEAGVIHRDIKPGNLLLPRGGQVKVTDFGIAKAVGETTELTRTGTMVGSPAYMAPEQVQNLPLDGRSDLFSLGVVLFEMLLHRKPFPADTLTSLVYQILYEDPCEAAGAEIAALRPELGELLRWCLAKEPALRVPDARTLAERARSILGRLQGAASGTAPTARLAALRAEPAAPQSAARRPGRLLPWLAIGSFVVLLALVLLWRQPPPPPPANLTGSAAAERSSPPPAVSPVAPGERPPAAPAAEAPLAPAGTRGTQALSEESRSGAAMPVATPAALEAPAAATPPAAALAAPAAPAPQPSEVFSCRRGAEFHVEPEEALVTVEGRLLGKADDWDGMGGGQTYLFPGPGSYLVRLELAGFRTTWIRVDVTPGAEDEIVDVDTELDEID